MTINKELESALHYFEDLPQKETFFKRFHDLSNSLIPPLLSHFGMMGQMAVQFIGKERIVEIIEQNLILMAHRAFQAFDSFDKNPLEYRLSYIVDSLILLSKECDAWSAQLQATCAPIHSKKKRKQRREEHHEVDLSDVAIEAIQALKPIFFPEGYDSLYLPEGSHMLISQIENQIDYTALVEMCVATLFHRDNKMNALYCIIAALHKMALSSDPISFVEEIPEQLVDRLAPAIEPLVRVFFRPFSSMAHLIPKQMGAKKLLGAVAGNLGDITSLMLSFVGSFEERYTESALIRLIDRVSEDEKAAKALIVRCLPQAEASLPEGRPPSFFDLLSFGFKSSVAHMTAENILSSVDWKGGLLSTLETVRCFVGSPYCDRWLLQTLGRFPL